MLEEAVQSVLTQTYTDYELFILDDNSSLSEQHALIAGYWNDPRVRVYKDNVSRERRRDRVRYATMINVGLQLARGEYITYLCDDDLFLPDRLETMTARLDQGDCQVVYGEQQMENYRGADRGIRFQAAGVLENAYGVDHSSVMHTKGASDAVGGWDDNPGRWHDADAAFWARLTSAGYHFHPVNKVTDIHRFHDASVQSSGYGRDF
jgi:spore maturation protein CgeD